MHSHLLLRRVSTVKSSLVSSRVELPSPEPGPPMLLGLVRTSARLALPVLSVFRTKFQIRRGQTRFPPSRETS